MKFFIYTLTALLLSTSGMSQTDLGGNAPGTETYPDKRDPSKTPSGVDKDAFEGESMKIDSIEGKQRMEDVDNTGDYSKKNTHSTSKENED